MVEAPDHGHETTSEAYSYYLWLEAVYGQVTGDWSQVQRRLGLDGDHTSSRPRPTSRPTPSTTRPSRPRTRPSTWRSSNYPTAIEPGVSVGSDPIAGELQQRLRHRRTSTACTGCWTSTTPTASAAAATAPPSPPTSTPTSAARRSRSSRRSRSRPATPSSYGGTNGFLDLFIDGQLVRQAVEVHQRPRRRRARRAGGVLGADLGQGAGQGVADLGDRGQGRQDGRLPALRDVRQVLQEARLHQPVVPGRAPARTPPATCCPGITRGAARPTPTPAGPGGSAPATTTPATRTRSRPGRWRTSPSCGR